MSRRFLDVLGVGAVLGVIVLLLRFAPLPVGAQTPAGTGSSAPPATAGAPAAKAGPAPTTPWGEPDLQGIWTRDSDEPLQRPAKYSNKEFLTDEERAALDKEISVIVDEKRRKVGGSAHEQMSAARPAAVFLTLRTGRRTSMIVEPRHRSRRSRRGSGERSRAIRRGAAGHDVTRTSCRHVRVDLRHPPQGMRRPTIPDGASPECSRSHQTSHGLRSR
jgi:hypothetical protein